MNTMFRNAMYAHGRRRGQGWAAANVDSNSLGRALRFAAGREFEEWLAEEPADDAGHWRVLASVLSGVDADSSVFGPEDERLRRDIFPTIAVGRSPSRDAVRGFFDGILYSARLRRIAELTSVGA